MHLCVVISSIGRTERLSDLLASLLVQSEQSFTVGICDQSVDGVVRSIADDLENKLDLFILSSSKGLSRGRNAVVKAAPGYATHFIFPNDTSILPPTFVEDLYRSYYDVDVLAVSYVDDNGSPRYAFEAGNQRLTARNVWDIIEPAMVLSRRAYDLAGGFDESLGTGSDTPWQSGEGTDLLLKIRSKPLDIAWDPFLSVHGVRQEFGLSVTEHRAKLRAYGRGYGFVLGSWRYSIWKRLAAPLGPFVGAAKSRSWPIVVDSVYSSVGRVEGLLGGAKAMRRQAL